MNKSGDDPNITKNTAGGKGAGLRTVNRAFLVMVILITAALIVTSITTYLADKKVREASALYIKCQKSESEMQLGSDYLTEQARLFVITGDPENADNYFEEANKTRRRDRSLETIKEIFGGTKAYDYLSRAMAESNSLMDIEYRAMKLMAEGRHIESRMPEEIRDYELSKKDEALSDGQKMNEAKNLMFGRTYKKYKSTISDDVNSSLRTIVEKTQASMDKASRNLGISFRLQFILIAILIVLCFVIVAFYRRRVVMPVLRGVGHIEQNEHMPVEGAKEIRYLANSYNVVLDETNRSHEKLSYEASHDVLTGVYNRKAFDSIQQYYDEKDICLMLVDVDYFKDINDTHGHQTGDRVLCRVADLLVNSFRSEDQICRIGGDEFAVIMVNANSGIKELVRSKLEEIREQLKEPKDGLPSVTLSIGIAFGDRENPESDIYDDADKMLYKVKDRGRNGFEFY